MSEKLANTFNDGMNMDASDFVLQDSQLRYAKNIRFFNLEGSNYVISNLNGTQQKFLLTAGFVPVAAQEFNDILYIISYNQNTTEIEIGSYPSPSYDGGSIWQYRPFNNLGTSPAFGPFRTTAFTTSVIPPIIQKLEIQPDYDQSVNLCFTIEGTTPKLINSKFKYYIENDAIEILGERDGASNTYNPATILEETATILASDKILKIAFGSITTGGKLKPGNYVYAFKYMSEDLNKTGIIGQSSICQVAYGSFYNARKGGNELEQTNLKTTLLLSNLDTNFKFLKVYAVYTAGQDSLYQQFLEFPNPIEITGPSMSFVHDGYEQMEEVTSSEVNLNYAAVDAAGCCTQVNGYFFLANITQRSIDLEVFKTESYKLEPILASTDVSITGSLPGYSDPANVYNYMGGMGGESYPYGIVYVLPGNVLTPVFPIKGKNFKNNTAPGLPVIPQVSPADLNGIVTYPDSHKFPFVSASAVKSRHIQVQMNVIPQSIKDQSIGFFFVRGERRTDLLTQGVIVPTIKAPNVDSLEAFTVGEEAGASWYYRYRADMYNMSLFKHLPIVDQLMEAYVLNVKGDDDDVDEGGEGREVIDKYGRISAGFMPIYITDMKARDAEYKDPWVSGEGETSLRHWALLSADAILAEPSTITTLSGKKETGILQIAKLNATVKGQITPLCDHIEQNNTPVPSTGLFYDFSSYGYYTTPTIKTAEDVVYVPGETLATGSDFISKIRSTFCLMYNHDGDGDGYYFYVAQNFNAFFGLKMKSGSNLVDADKGNTKPIGGNSRNGVYATPYGRETFGVNYSNLSKNVPIGFLVNVYNSNIPAPPEQLYDNVDNIVYKQVTPRYAWSEAAASGLIDVYGGDCYIGKIHRKLNQCPFRNPMELPDPYDEVGAYPGLQNIDAGLMISWYQESKHNVYLRQPGIVDLSEPGERSFFPYQSNGDFNNYRKYRLPETIKYSPGYSEALAPKEHFKSSSLTSYIENNFFVRIMHSVKHVPNAFKNGYRMFLPNAFKDYDSAMGKIVAMFNHRGSLLVIFEHGIGITTIEQRVETANDIAGAVYIQPSEVLPPQLQYWSKEIGCQDHLSLVQTPSAVYGIDASKSVIWQVRDNLIGISDQGFASFVRINGLANPRSGFDFDNKEVVFTTNNWTLCFKEGLEKFTSFYSFRADYYARRQKDFYSFLGSTSHIHNQGIYKIYDKQEKTIVEFVINKNLDAIKILDWITLISNDIVPEKAEIYSYNLHNHKKELIDVLTTNQYTVVLNQVDPVTEENIMEYRDKKISIQVPEAVHYDRTLSDDEWAAGGRMRNKYLIVRLTYDTDKPLQLASIISTFRYSYA